LPHPPPAGSKDLAVQVVSQGGDYVWSVKANKESLLTDLQILFEPEPVAAGCSPHPTVARPRDKGQGRLEERVLTANSWLKESTPWPYLEQAFKLERTVYTLEGKLVSEEVRYGITHLFS